MESFENKITRNHNDVNAFASTAFENDKLLEAMMKEAVANNATALEYCLIASHWVALQGGWADGCLYEMAYSERSKSRRTPEAHKDFENGYDAKRTAANFEKEKAVFRSRIKDIKKPGGIVSSTDVTKGKIVIDDKLVENVYACYPPALYLKQTIDQNGKTVNQGAMSQSVDVTTGKITGKKARFQVASLEEQADIVINHDHIIKPDGTKVYVDGYDPEMYK